MVSFPYSVSIRSNHREKSRCYTIFQYSNSNPLAQCFSTATEFPVNNAYEILGISETSSFAKIKASFRKLAKETHPDLAASKNDSSASHRFIQILAAYEILSDSERRALYDNYLMSRRKVVQKHSKESSKFYPYKSQMTTSKQMEVVEWLKWYRLAINDIVAEKKVAVGTGYFDVLEADFYSAIHAAYYGPIIESKDLLPDQFEAEVRSVYDTPEVLHLVSGRDAFGMVCLANDNPELSSACTKHFKSFTSIGLDFCQPIANTHIVMDSNEVKHMHWYGVGLADKVAVCECNCSRAQLPPSRFWLFEPRCDLHDVGGWYVETFGRDKKSRTVPSQRHWDGFDGSEQYDKRLHPAMYLLLHIGP